MTSGWIAVLDDSLSRVAALRDLRTGCRIVHAVRVTTFMNKLRSTAHQYGHGPSLIILDHDLGIGSFEDLDGNNGMDAARMLVDGDWRAWRTPVLIWSTNADAAPRMQVVLRGYIHAPPVATIPFHQPERWQPWVRQYLAR